MLIAAVLLQPGKTDAGALFTSNVSSSAFSPRGTATVLSKITIVAAAAFMLSALMLAMPALTGNVSVLSSNPDDPTATESVVTDEGAEEVAPGDGNINAEAPADANSNAAVPAEGNANVAVDTEANTAPAADAPPAANGGTPANN